MTLLKDLLGSTSSNSNLKFFVNALGSGKRAPGLYPYVMFVLEAVLLKLDCFTFAIPEEQDRMTADSLEIVNKCLELFEDDCRGFLLNQNLSQTGNIMNEYPYSKDDFLLVMNSPGFQILCSILSGSKITRVLFEILKSHDALSLDSRRYDIGLLLGLCLRI